MNQNFSAFIVEESEPKQFTHRVGERSISDLPEGDILIRVAYSSLNYKDGLSASGNRGVTRNFPHTPGVDAAGTVEASTNAAFEVGDEVIVIGFDLGMNTPGGYGQYIRVPAGWVVKRPENLSLRESMIMGTAGFTAAQSVDALVNRAGIQPDDGPIAVTGATGGVGSVSVAILGKLGYEVVAYTGKLDETDFLKSLGAADVKHRDEMNDDSGRPMLRGVLAGAIDTVGGNPLTSLLKSVKYGGAVTCCGLVAGPSFTSSVFPFILRGVSLLGIDSVECPLAEKERIWNLIAERWKVDSLDTLVKEVAPAQLGAEIDLILKGKQRGRVLVNLWPTS